MSEVRIGLAENEVGVEAIPDALTDFFFICVPALYLGLRVFSGSEARGSLSSDYWATQM
jgi:hypothetical protein